jgi:hypothetical protein
MITGFTSHKLDVVSTYSKSNPFQVGVNGVTNIEYDPVTLTGITKIYYTIGSIDYVTTYQPKSTSRIRAAADKSSTNLRIISPEHPTIFSTSVSGYDFDEYYSIKEEAKMGLVFPPKVSNELFIERMNVAVFERHSRLSEVKTLDGLIEYRNGYYNIIENR